MPPNPLPPTRRAALRARAVEYATKWPSTAKERKLADGLLEALEETEAEDRDRTQAGVRRLTELGPTDYAALAVAEAAAAFIAASERVWAASCSPEYATFAAALQAKGEALAALRAAVARWEEQEHGTESGG